MAKEVYMDVPKVIGFGDTMENLGEAVKRVSNVLNTLITALKATAFIGLFGNFVMTTFLEQMKPKIDKLAEDCIEIGGDLKASARAYQNGDAMGGTRFY